MLRVVLFSGGRGSDALTRQLLTREGVILTVAINGYDDGASTGEVRRFLGDSLGPSDFRKNASRIADELHSCSGALLRLLDARLPPGITVAAAIDELQRLTAEGREAAALALEARQPPLALNPRLASAIGAADLIIYAPGTQHSSLFPSYMTPGLADTVAANLKAIKLLVTNIQTDAEITGS